MGRGASESSFYKDSLDEAIVKRWLGAAYEEAKADQEDADELKHVDRYIKYLKSQQWNTEVTSYKEHPVNNRLLRNYNELLAQLTDLRPISEVRTTEPTDSPIYDQCVKQENTINERLKAWWINNYVDLSVAMCIAWGILTTAFAKFVYNPEARLGLGDIELYPLAPKELLLLKPKLGLQSSEAVIYEYVEPVGKAKRKYPRAAHLIQADPSVSKYIRENRVSGTAAPYRFDILTPAMQRITGGDARLEFSSFPQATIREHWFHDYSYNVSGRDVLMGDPNSNWCYVVKPHGRLYPRGRLIVTSNGPHNIISDTPNPWWHGRYPFGMLRLNVVPWQVYGFSQMSSWCDLQDLVNKIYAGVLNVIKKAVNPTMIAPKQAFTPDQWEKIDTGMPNLRLRYNPQSPQEPKFVVPPQLPGYVLPMLMQVEKEMDAQSGTAAANQMVGKKQMPGKDTIDQIRDIYAGPVRMQGRNIEIFLRELGEMQVINMFQFFSKSERVHIPGVNGSEGATFDWKPQQMIPPGSNGQEHVKRFHFYLQEGSLLSVQKTEKKLELYRLRLMGDVDRRTLLRLSDSQLPVDQIEQNLKKERAEGLGPMPMKGNKKGAGKGAPPPA